MGQPLILSLDSPFPEASWFEGAEYESEWHLAKSTHYLEQAELLPEDAPYYYFWGSVHALMSLPYQIPLLNCVIYAVNYLALSIVNPHCIQTSMQEALQEGNLEGAYQMYLRGGDPALTNDANETLLDLYAKNKGLLFRHRTYQLVLNDLPFNPEALVIQELFKKAAYSRRRDVIRKLLEKGVEPRSWKIAAATPQPLKTRRFIPSKLRHFIQETSQECIGRMEEKREMERVFLQRYKNSPLLYGNNGVGKTALANSYPEKRVINVKITHVQKASRAELKALKDFFLLHKSEIVLLLDDLDDISEELLKSFLSTFEEIPRIGCSRQVLKLSEYFTPIEVKELPPDEIQGIAKRAFPEIDEGILNEAIRLCARHVTGESLPKSLLATLDRAYTFIQTQEKYGSLKRQLGEDVREQEEKEKTLQKLKEKRTFFEEMGLDERNAALSREIEELENEIGEERLFLSEIALPLIKHILNPYTPPADIEAYFKEHIFGQDHVIEAIIPYVSNAAKGISPSNKAQGGLHFVGLTGTGKTELAKTIAKYLNVSFLHIDMSKYREAHQDSTLTGASAGYVGFEKGGLIQEEAKKGPMVLLLDEVDKANPKVLENTLMHLLEEGTMLDPLSRKNIKMHNVFVILASNLGSTAIINGMQRKGGLFFANEPKDCSDPDVVLELIQPALEEFVKQNHALLARLKTVPFIPLQEEDSINQITIKFLENEKVFTEEMYQVTLSWTDEFISSFTSLVKPKDGVRPIRNYIENTLRYKISEACANATGKSLHLDYEEDDILTFTP